MASRYFNPKEQYLTRDGKQAAVRDKFEFFAPGTNNDKALFSDAGQVTSIASTQLTNSNGELPNIFYNGSADIRRTDDNGVERSFVTNVEGASTPNTFQDYSATVTYSIFDIVRASDGVLYESRVNSNLNNDPANEANPLQWIQIQFLGTWNPNVTYAINDLVQASDGIVSRSLINGNLNNDPISDTTNWGASAVADIPDEIESAASIFNYNNIKGFD